MKVNDKLLGLQMAVNSFRFKGHARRMSLHSHLFGKTALHTSLRTSATTRICSSLRLDKTQDVADGRGHMHGAFAESGLLGRTCWSLVCLSTSGVVGGGGVYHQRPCLENATTY